ncbi:Uncharacterized protein Rv1507c [Chlamydiales bacterium SCGC AG-110-M15]|nr:Uncharacterized protein Rv1507c [Chlamydiales bacterium SCGC AG-110-M15]
MRRVVILQPSYLPWQGYFAQIAKADIFVFLDNVQYTKGDWRNRNRILNSNGTTQYLSVPVHFRHSMQSICEVEIDHRHRWVDKHVRSLFFSYRHTPFFNEVLELVKSKLENKQKLLSDLNISLIQHICEYMEFSACEFVRASDLPIFSSHPTRRLLEICQHFNASNYLTGSKASDYLDELAFSSLGVELEYLGDIHPEYAQNKEIFCSHLSILDLLFRLGLDARKLLANWALKNSFKLIDF